MASTLHAGVPFADVSSSFPQIAPCGCVASLATTSQPQSTGPPAGRVTCVARISLHASPTNHSAMVCHRLMAGIVIQLLSRLASSLPFIGRTIDVDSDSLPATFFISIYYMISLVISPVFRYRTAYVHVGQVSVTGRQSVTPLKPECL